MHDRALGARELRQVEPWFAIGPRTMAMEILRKASAHRYHPA
jgi:hypothetical protein